MVTPDLVETLIAFDYGSKRIGVAVGQTMSNTAEPLAVVRQKQHKIDWDTIQKIVAEWRPNRVVIGFPATKDGQEHKVHTAIRHFASELEKRFCVPVEFVDERLSSYEAASQQSSRHEIDAVAAQLILESWLNAQRMQKN